jgi:hypothetical protein
MEDISQGIILTESCLSYAEQSVERDEGINFWKSLSNVTLVALNHTSSDEKTPEASRLLQLREFQYAIDALFHRALKEPTGINHRDISAAEIINDLETRIPEDADHHLGVYLILGAPKGHDSGATSERLPLTRLRFGDVYGYRTALSRLVSERENG